MSEEYLYLFNTVSAAIEELEEIRSALIAAQQRCEEIYMERGD